MKQQVCSLFIFLCLIFGLRTKAQNVTVSGAVSGNGSYPNVQAAFAAINGGGQTGANIAVIIGASTTETATAVLFSGTWNSLSLIPSGGSFTVSGSLTAPIIDLNGADNVYIDGLNAGGNALTIINYSTSATAGTSAMRFINGATSNTVVNCTLLGSSLGASSGVLMFYTTNTVAGNSNNSVSNCTISAAGTNYPVNCIYSSGSAANVNSGNIIQNCDISDFFRATTSSNGIFISTNNTSWSLLNNKIYQTGSRVYTSALVHRAIQITSGVGHTVNGNIIGYANANGSGNYAMGGTINLRFIAIDLSLPAGTVSSVQGNTISAISLTTSAAAAAAATGAGVLCGINIINATSVDVGTQVGNVIGGTIGTNLLSATHTSSPALNVAINVSTTGSVSLQNNYIGGLECSSTGAAVGSLITGLNVISPPAQLAISNNTIGNPTPLNMQAGTAGVTTGNSMISAITLSATFVGNLSVTNNLIQNLASYGTGTGGYARGIWNTTSSTGGIFAILNNTVSGIVTDNTNTNAVGGQVGTFGIGLGSGSTSSVSGNYLSSISNINNTTIGIVCAGITHGNASNSVLSENQIYDISNASTSSSATSPGIAAGILVRTGPNLKMHNNMISLGSGQTSNTSFIGLYLNNHNGGVYSLFHNSINIEGTATSGAQPSFGIFRGDFSAAPVAAVVDIRNNLITNSRSGGTGGHFAIGNFYGATASATGWTLNASNNNVLNANPATIGWWGGAQSFSGWNSVCNCDYQSFSGVSVTYVNSTNDLHLNMGLTQTNLESGGQSISSVTVDIDQETRPGPQGSLNGGGQFPDIGADEIDGVPLDGAGPSIAYSPLPVTCSTGDRTFTATITDFSGVPVSGPLQPVVYFKKNAGSYVSTQGMLSSGTGTNGVWTFTIDAALMGGLSLGDVVSYYVIAQDISPSQNISALPLNGLVATSVNSVTTAPTIPNSYTISALSGTYTVGAGGNFPTLTSAAFAYNTNCLAGPVTFVLTDLLYSSSETFPIVFTNNIYASAINSLLIIPSTGTAVVITPINPATNSGIKFLNARHITLDGLNSGGSSITINNPNGTSSSANVWLASSNTPGSGNQSIGIKNLIVNGGSNTFVTSFGILAAVDGAAPTSSGGMDNDDIVIEGNLVLKTYSGIYANGVGSTHAGGVSNLVVTSNTVGPVNSSVDNIGRTGIYVQNAVSPVVTNNLVQNINSVATSQASGIYLISTVNGATVKQNTITEVYSAAASSGVNSVNGIYLGTNVINSNVEANTITGVANTNTLGYGARGIILNTGNASSNNTITNNMISNIRSYSDVSAVFWPIGISLDGATGGINIDFNTVHLSGSVPSLTTNCQSAAFYQNSTGGNLVIRNNIFSNSYDHANAANDNIFALYSAQSATKIVYMDYNDYYVGGTASVKVLAYVGSNRNSLYDIQLGFGLGNNLHSMTFEPVFTSSVDLHLDPSAVTNAGMNNSGLPVLGITTDIDAQTRNGSTPDIGADEFNAVANCTTAAGGTIAPSSYTLCMNEYLHITSENVSTGLSTTYAWKMSATPGGPYTVTANSLPGATIPTYVNNLSTGTYYMVFETTCAQAALTSVSNEATVTVLANSTPSAVSSNTIVCSGGSATLTAAGASSYTWSTGPVSPSVVVTPTINTTYTLTGAGLGTCPNVQVTVEVLYSDPAIVITSPATLVCSGTQISLSASGAASYTWNTGDNGNSIAPVILGQSNFSVNGEDMYGCPASSTFTVDAMPSPSLLISGPTGLCTGQSLTLSVSGADSYTWNTGSNSTSIVDSPSSTTVYSVTGINAFGCISVESQTVSLAASLSISIIGTPTLCYGENLNLSANGGQTYTWNTGATTSSITDIPTTVTEYSVIGASGSCSNTAMISVTVMTTPVISVSGNTVVCSGETTTLFANGTNTYSWSTASVGNSVTVSPLTTTIYSVTGTDAVGCSTTNTISVISNTVPVLTIAQSTTAVCYQMPVTLTASGASSYTWDSGSNNPTRNENPTSNTIYTITGTNPEGCISSNTVAVTVYSLPVLMVTPNNYSVCPATPISFVASGASTYVWDNTINGSVYAFTPTASGIHTLTGTSSNGCVSSTTVPVTVFPAATITTFPPSATVCAMENINFTAIGAVSYSWNGVPGTWSITLSHLNNTTHTVTGIDVNGCSGTATIDVMVNPIPSLTISATATAACLGSTIGLSCSGANNYTWFPGGQSQQIVVNPSVSTNYSVTGINSFGCTSSALHFVQVNPLPIVSVAATHTNLCLGNSTNVQATGNSNTYIWSNGATSSIIQVSPTSSTMYSVTGTSTLTGCTKTQSITINVFTALLGVTGPTATCPGGTVTISASGASSYTWNTGSNFNTIWVSPPHDSVFTVSALVNTLGLVGCPATASVQVSILPLPVVTASVNKTPVCRNEAIILSGSGASTYTWSTQNIAATFTVKIPSSTVYTVSGTDANGCTNTASVSVVAHSCIGFDDLVSDELMSIFPNPSQGLITIQFGYEGEREIEVCTATGALIRSEKTTNREIGLDLSDSAKGIYFVKIINEGRASIHKIIVQ